ncbi:MAG: hypothetical protein H7338_03720 [Candidatus Sericytochromatia bacterium]|nr:hypothetical protein [Candidatus Sericytochromatia bacterium]
MNGRTVTLLLALTIVPVSRSAGTATPGLTETIGTGMVNWTAGRISVSGMGVAPDRGHTAQQRLLARRAAIVDGYRQIAEIVNGVRVSSETVVKDCIVAYTSSVAEAPADTDRAGTHPLVVTAHHSGGRFKADAILSHDSSAALALADQANTLLAQTKVPFVIQR